MSLFSILSLARDGVMTSSGALNVTTQNIAGASTPGFVRRTPVLQARASGGVEMSTISRSFDKFSYDQMVGQESLLSSARARAGAMVTVEAVIAPTTDSLAARAGSLLQAFHELALHPADPSVRAVVLERAEVLASGFSDTARSLDALGADLYTGAREVAGSVNVSLERLSTLDRQLSEAQARGEPVSDLRDVRDQVVRDIATRTGARAIEGGDGAVTLFAGGAVLYEGGRTSRIDVALDGEGAMSISVHRGGQVTDVTAGLQGGTLAGLREARDVDLAGVKEQVHSYAYDVANMFNDIHVQGFGLDGTGGRPLFTPPTSRDDAAHTMSIDASIAGHPELVGASGSASDVPGGNDIARLLAGGGEVALAGGGTISERFGAIASRVGVIKSAAESDERMREDTVAAATSLRESASGVSTDEEMIRLQQFQRSFEAATRVLRMVDELFDTLFQAF
jgi:flagellar hook-associated protein 1 FlgK